MAAAGLNVSFEGPLFQLYFFYSALLGLKMLFLAVLTTTKRIKNKAVIVPEDGDYLNVKPRIDEDVERVRRAHQNDMENTFLFFVIAFLYILTNPAIALASLLIRVFVATRFAHSIFYLLAVPQPARALAFLFGWGITVYMAVQIALYFF